MEQYLQALSELDYQVTYGNQASIIQARYRVEYLKQCLDSLELKRVLKLK